MKYAIFSLAIVFVLGLSFSFAFAQIGPDIQTTVNVDLSPEHPGPNQQVTAYATSYVTDIDSANITWILDGKEQKGGVGEKTFYFSTGDFNKTTTLEVKIETVEGNKIDKIFDIKPTSVDVLWQTDGFTPPFYKGKALFTHQNTVTFIAIPHIVGSNGRDIPAKNLVYTWTKNGSVMGSDSGYGKNTYTFQGPLISRPVDISVKVTDTGTGNSAIAYTVAKPQEPMIMMYRKNPSYGIEFQKALTGSIKLTDSKEISIIGEPFFFGDVKSLYYKWFINGAPINNSPDSTTQVFRQQDGVSGTSNISLSIENPPKILQFAQADFNLEFGKEAVVNNQLNF